MSIKNSDRSWALQLLMKMGLPLDEQPENVWASTRWAWTGLRKTENNVGKIKKNNRYSVEDWHGSGLMVSFLVSYRILILLS